MSIVFVSRPTDKIERYFGPNAMGSLQAIAEVRFDPEAHDLSMPQPIVAAQGCDALIAYRQTPVPKVVFRALPELNAFIRCAARRRA